MLQTLGVDWLCAVKYTCGIKGKHICFVHSHGLCSSKGGFLVRHTGEHKVTVRISELVRQLSR